MYKDNIFDKKQMEIAPFEFNEQVTNVFDDMITRSVPLYHESITRQSLLAFQFYQSGTIIYDLGCSHGNVGLLICNIFKDRDFSMIAVDSSLPMINRYQKRLLVNADFKNNNKNLNGGNALKHKVNLVCGLAENIRISRASVVIVNLTLQFIQPEKRDGFVRQIYKGLVPGGILILTEKIVHPDPVVSNIDLLFYQRFKRENGYSELEISQKRDALENVLIPESLQTHDSRLNHAGFSHIEVWLKWFNFASIIAIK